MLDKLTRFGLFVAGIVAGVAGTLALAAWIESDDAQ